jgi:cation diffusion facilitator CzcD-associated flavoprotein CzcO
MWRPDGWKNPYPSIHSGLPTTDYCYSEYDLHDAHEAGADAILKALRDAGYMLVIIADLNTPGGGNDASSRVCPDL